MTAKVSDAARKRSRPSDTVTNIGKVYGMLTVLSGATMSRRGIYWKCRCKCGKIRVARASHIVGGHTKSCGCLISKTVSTRRWAGHAEISATLWSSVKHNAKTRGLDLTVTIEQAWDLFIAQERCCALSGLPLRFCRIKKGGWSGQTASLDRIDSSKGYVPGNVQWVHKHVNIMKQDMSDETFIGWCMTIAHHAGAARPGYRLASTQFRDAPEAHQFISKDLSQFPSAA